MPRSELGRDSGGRKRSSERQSTRKHLSAAAQGRCQCGRLLTICGKGGMTIKCKRCKSFQFFSWLELDRRRRELRE